MLDRHGTRVRSAALTGRTLIGIITLLFCLVQSADAGPDPDCGSSQTRDLLNQLLNRHWSEVPTIGQALRSSTASKADEARSDALAADCARKLGKKQKKLGDSVACIQNDPRWKEGLRFLERAGRDTVLSVENIRVTAKDATTGAVTCAADLDVRFEDGHARNGILFTIERTTDGKLYGTIFGLESGGAVLQEGR
jgi:hypothetical protein